MKTSRLVLATLALPLLAVPAMADDDPRCGNVAAADWLSVVDITARAQAAGYTVREVERDDNCYDVDGTDSSGRKVEVRMHPGTGAVIEVDVDD
jgi:hypothetical protein